MRQVIQCQQLSSNFPRSGFLFQLFLDLFAKGSYSAPSFLHKRNDYSEVLLQFKEILFSAILPKIDFLPFLKKFRIGCGSLF